MQARHERPLPEDVKGSSSEIPFGTPVELKEGVPYYVTRSHKRKYRPENSKVKSKREIPPGTIGLARNGLNDNYGVGTPEHGEVVGIPKRLLTPRKDLYVDEEEWGPHN